MSYKRLICAVAGKGKGDDLRNQIRIARAGSFCPVREVLGKFAIRLPDMLDTNNPRNLRGRHVEAF